jgi:multiple sugar transport system substrate-binding protein
MALSRFLRSRAVLPTAALTCVAMTTACSGGSSDSPPAAAPTRDVTISVVLATDPPPQAAMAAFTQQTGITVRWTNVDWDSLQTKITAAVTAKTYFADATDVDWSRVGQLSRLNAFYPMDQLIDTASLAGDMPQLSSFTAKGHVVGVPYDASFDVTTVNKTMFAKAGVALPQTMDQYTQALKTLKSKGTVQYSTR